MALNIKNTDVEALVADVAELTGESKTEAVRRSLEERRDRLRRRQTGMGRGARLQRFLDREVDPRLPEHVRGKAVTKAEWEDILGYGLGGV